MLSCHVSICLSSPLIDIMGTIRLRSLKKKRILVKTMKIIIIAHYTIMNILLFFFSLLGGGVWWSAQVRVGVGTVFIEAPSFGSFFFIHL